MGTREVVVRRIGHPALTSSCILAEKQTVIKSHINKIFQVRIRTIQIIFKKLGRGERVLGGEKEKEIF